MFTHRTAKLEALIQCIHENHRSGRPVLAGTASVAESEELGNRLLSVGLSCEVLNARNDAAEAEVIEEAGAPGAITISTNMAGRGTDIRLGGRDESRRVEVISRGGLCVIGTNRHESRRIDDQLRGRAGRQGDSGSSRFYISLEDSLIPERYRRPVRTEPLDHPVVQREIVRAQRIVEGQSFEIRRTLSRYSQFIEGQRRQLFERRELVLSGQNQFLQEHEPDLYASHCSVASHSDVAEAERLITLHHLDAAWRDHLAEIAMLRDGIHLVGLGGLNPIDEFHKAARVSFDEITSRIDEAIIKTFRAVRMGPAGIDLEQEGLRGPASTWT